MPKSMPVVSSSVSFILKTSARLFFKTSFETFQTEDIIRTTLSCLSPKQQKILILRDFEGFSAKDIADILGTSKASVRVMLCRVREKFRKIYLKLENEEV